MSSESPAPRIILEAVEANRRDVARAELTQITEGTTPPLMAVFVARNIAEAFQRLFPGIEPLAPLAAPAGDEVSGLARTLPFRLGTEIAYVLGIAAPVNPGAFVKWSDDERPLREWTIWHELTHVQDMAVQVHATGPDSFAAMFRAGDAAAVARHNAHFFWWEYHAFRHVTASMTKWHIGKQLWSHAHGIDLGYHEHLRDYLTSLPGVEGYDPDHALEIRSNLPYFWAAVMGLEDAGASIPADYKDTAGYKRALAPHEPTMRSLMQRMFERPAEYRVDLLEELAAQLRKTRRGIFYLAQHG